MRIEKISETQVKFILSKEDLDERSINISELSYGSEKTHKLFQEMMKQANIECNFESENTPLMVEAMPVGKNDIVIVVTKILDTSEEENPFNMFPKARSNDFFKTHGFRKAAEETETNLTDTLSIFSFVSLDDAALASKRLTDHFMGQSRFYKNDDRYFLVIQEDAHAAYAIAETEMVLYEYGEKHISTEISENYLAEHGEVLIPQQAIDKLAWYL